jgi:peptidylprolyl isomerase
MSAAAKAGDTVVVHYTGKLEDGLVFDSSRDRQPLKFKLGESRVLPGFEKAVMGMAAGEEKEALVESAEAYGEHRPEMVVQIERSELPPNLDVSVGKELQVQSPSGQTIPARCIDATDSSVTLDANHPLSGKSLTFEIELVEIVN